MTNPGEERDLILQTAFREAEEVGVRLEIINRLGVWEASPTLRHVKAEKRILASVRRPQGSPSDCGSFWYQDLPFRLPDDAVRRPDISVFGSEPQESEAGGGDEALRLVPEGVVDIVSRGSETKDVLLGPENNLKNGVKDVVFFDPYAGIVWHHRRDRGVVRLDSPSDITLECGCLVTV